MNNRLTIVMIASALLLVGCKTTEEPPAPATEGFPGLPAGTIQTGESTYMVPLSAPDTDGCQGYRVHSPGRMTVQAIYYRTADGEFTPNKLQAACRQDGDQ